MKKMKLVAVTAAVLLMVACGKQEGAEEHGDEHDEKKPVAQAAEHAENIIEIEEGTLRDLKLTTAVVEQRPGGEAVKILGELQANQNAYAEVGSPVTARVVRVVASEGQVVRAGQTLAELQSTELGRARADLYAAQARYEVARKTLERKRSLGVDRIVPRREVQEAEADVAAATADLNAARASLNALGVGSGGNDGSHFALRSPINGTVLNRSVSLGQMIDASRSVFTIGHLGTLWLTGHAFERDAIRIQPGAEARVALAAMPGQALTGRVTFVGAQVEAASRTIPVRIEITNSNNLLRPGMSATALVPVSQGGAPVLTVPVAALQRVRDAWAVFIQRSPKTFEIRPVGRGRDLEGEVEILTGLKPGEAVVVEGAFLLKAEAEKASGEGDHHDH